MKLRLPWPLRKPSPIFQSKATALEPKVNFNITDGSIELNSKLSANALSVDSDGVQLHCPNPSCEATETAWAAELFR